MPAAPPVPRLAFLNCPCKSALHRRCRNQYNSPMHSPRPFSRRAFLKATAASSMAVPFFVPRLLSAPPSDRVLHASFGASGMARTDLNTITSHPNVQFVTNAAVEPAKADDLK